MTDLPQKPVIILVEPQLAENIGMVARAMANFGLSELRLVSPRNGWPKKGAHSAASGATHVLEGAKLYDTVREAIAAAARKTNSVRPGQVLAAEGLEIKTRAPRWTTTMMYLYRPQNPVLSITFGRDGRVINAEFLRAGNIVYGSGYTDVDQTLLNAVYGWTATGKPLEALDPAHPERGVSILMTILLRG